MRTGGVCLTPSSTGNTAAVHHYHIKPVASKGVRQNLQAIVAKNRVKEVIAELQKLSEGDAEFQKLVIHQSANWENLKRDEMLGIISHSDAGIVRNKIINAVLGLVSSLAEK